MALMMMTMMVPDQSVAENETNLEGVENKNLTESSSSMEINAITVISYVTDNECTRQQLQSGTETNSTKNELNISELRMEDIKMIHDVMKVPFDDDPSVFRNFIKNNNIDTVSP